YRWYRSVSCSNSSAGAVLRRSPWRWPQRPVPSRTMESDEEHLTTGGAAEQARASLESALFEMKRVIVGQEQLLERVLVGLLVGGHLLIEGVPGLAKTLTVRTLADVVGGSHARVQFTPDLVPSDLVGTRIYRPGLRAGAEGTFDTELGPVFCNFLLA